MAIDHARIASIAATVAAIVGTVPLTGSGVPDTRALSGGPGCGVGGFTRPSVEGATSTVVSSDLLVSGRACLVGDVALTGPSSPAAAIG